MPLSEVQPKPHVKSSALNLRLQLTKQPTHPTKRL